MRLCLLFLLFLGAFAEEVSILDHLNNTDNFQLAANCPPLFYGSNCEIPHCFPEYGHLAKRGLNDYFCNCTFGTSGKHCEIINCNDGKVSTSTFECECSYYAFGSHCQNNIFVFAGIVAIFILFIIICPNENKEKSSANSTNNQTRSNAPQSPAAPEIRIVERVVIQERSDAPPTYDSAVKSADPPKYSV
uniref:EGF-like domain-containing protein n=1 Tax=Panagrellus redivivus TaxID=6233 RepID=A0A7E4VB57_PANRE